MSRTIVLFLAGAVVASALAGVVGCKSGDDGGAASGPAPAAKKAGAGPADTADKPGAGMRIALVVKTMSNPFFQRMEEGAKQKAEELGAELECVAPARETDIDDQSNKVRDMIQSGVDAVLVAPAGSKEIVPVLLEAKQAGIITINLDNRVDAEAMAAAGLELDAYVGADNEEGGYMAGKHLAELMGGKGVVTMIEGIPSADNAIARREGFERAMAESEGIEVIRPLQSGHWEQQEAYDIMTNLLQTSPELGGLFCANDMMALGAMGAIDDAGATGTLYVVSYDNLPEVQDSLAEG